MISIDEKIDRAQRLLRIIDEDAPLLHRRVAELPREQQQSAKEHVAHIVAQTRAEIAKLMEERLSFETDELVPAPAD